MLEFLEMAISYRKFRILSKTQCSNIDKYSHTGSTTTRKEQSFIAGLTLSFLTIKYN